MEYSQMSMLHLTDVQLVQLTRQGENDAFSELVRRHQRKCVDLASFLLRNRQDAEDEAQNGFVKAYTHLEQYQGEAEFSTWLARIVVNECLMLMRERRRARMVYLDEVHPEQVARPVELPALGPDPEGELAAQQMIDLLKIEIRRIPPLLRSVILLRDIQELPMPLVAEQLGITVAAAKSRLLRARCELRLHLKRHYHGHRGSSSVSRMAAPLEKLGRHYAQQAA